MPSALLFNDFPAEYRQIKAALNHAIQRVLQSGYFLLGKETSSFETELATALGAKYAVAVANGTEAIAIAVLASGILPGDEVIVPALTAYPTIIGLEMAKAVPVMCDVNLDTGLMDPQAVEKLITKKTKAIMPVHLFGQLCDMSAISKLAKKHKLLIIEDCAQAIFATHHHKLCGSWGQASCYSFYPSKNLGAYGDAGAVLTNNKHVWQQARQLRQYGQSTRYVHDQFGFNSRIDELQAAILRVKLPLTANWIGRRQEIAAYYLHHLRCGQPLATLPGNVHTRHLFVIRVKNRQKFLKFCQKKNIPVIVHYPLAVYQQPAFRHRFKRCLNAEQLVSEIVSLPIHPFLKNSQIARICSTLNSFKP